MSALTPFERKTLQVLAKLPSRETLAPSQVGFALQEFCDSADCKPNPSPQGMALFAGRFLSPLRGRGLVSSYKGWSITPAGRQALADAAAAEVDPRQVTVFDVVGDGSAHAA